MQKFAACTCFRKSMSILLHRIVPAYILTVAMHALVENVCLLIITERINLPTEVEISHQVSKNGLTRVRDFDTMDAITEVPVIMFSRARFA